MADKFKFLIASIFLGNVFGTNDPKAAEAYAASEEEFVLDIEAQEWILLDEEGKLIREPISELPPLNNQEQTNEG